MLAIIIIIYMQLKKYVDSSPRIPYKLNLRYEMLVTLWCCALQTNETMILNKAVKHL